MGLWYLGLVRSGVMVFRAGGKWGFGIWGWREVGLIKVFQFEVEGRRVKVF